MLIAGVARFLAESDVSSFFFCSNRCAEELAVIRGHELETSLECVETVRRLPRLDPGCCPVASVEGRDGGGVGCSHARTSPRSVRCRSICIASSLRVSFVLRQRPGGLQSDSPILFFSGEGTAPHSIQLDVQQGEGRWVQAGVRCPAEYGPGRNSFQIHQSRFLARTAAKRVHWWVWVFFSLPLLSDAYNRAQVHSAVTPMDGGARDPGNLGAS